MFAVGINTITIIFVMLKTVASSKLFFLLLVWSIFTVIKL